MKKSRASLFTVALCLIIAILFILIVSIVIGQKNDASEFKQVKSASKLERIYKKENKTGTSILTNILTLPLSLAYNFSYGPIYYASDAVYDGIATNVKSDMLGAASQGSEARTADYSTTEIPTSSDRDYSKTNIQVENVDEADITKTDGEYIYSLSEDKIIITDVREVDKAEVVASITMKNSSLPHEILIYGDKLVAIGRAGGNGYVGITWRYNYYSTESTNVEVFDITDKTNPTSIKSIEIRQPYYTCRCINGNVYVLSSGYLRENDGKKIEIGYLEDGIEKNISYDNMYYMEDMETINQTIIAGIDLNNLNSQMDIRSYFIDMYNAYVSENNIYIAERDYRDYDNIPLKAIFGFKGIFGIAESLNDLEYGEETTTIYKFTIEGTNVRFVNKVEDEGKTINQFSMDEYNGYLRVAMYDNNGTRINVYDANMNKIGKTNDLAKGENMYSSRFIGNRAYLVTYKTVDPLFVVDLSNPSNPTILGELKIPGYSTYLHPYDDDHIIGIGMETKENISRDLYGRVIGTTARIVGMKMALFDVKDVSSPKQISGTVIGDSRTTSAILTNHKALLFSKENNLIAIPVNNYSVDFEVENPSDNIDGVITQYNNNIQGYIAEGYEVYSIDTENGFVKKGTITHELEKNKDQDPNIYLYRTVTHLLRGLYIDDNLYTVSERMVKINKLDTLEQLKQISISKYINEKED